METLKKLISFIRQLPIAGKVISIIVITLIAILLTFFSAGCALKFHADSLDNVTLEHNVDVPVKNTL